MKQTLKLSFEMTDVLSRIEHNGLKINLDTLDQIEKEYEDEMHVLENRLNELAKEAMGDTPINLASPDDKSMLLYSRKVKDKALWSMTFNLGHEMRGNTIKPKMRTRMKNTDFVRSVRRMTDIVYKTIGRQCQPCNGSGRVTPPKKDGSIGKAKRICKDCIGKGVVYTSTGEVAGFKLIPRTVRDTASAGFKTDKVTLEDRLSELDGNCLLYTSPSPRDLSTSRMPSSA